jgi:hypothetical protein
VDVGVVGIVVGAAGIALAFLFYFRPRRSRRPTYTVTGNRVVGPTEKRIEIRFRQQIVPRVTRTVVVFVNSGPGTIVEDDIVETDPLHVVLTDGEILDAQTLAITRDAVEFQMLIESNTRIKFWFDHLDFKDGVVFEVLHTGGRPSAIKLGGTVRGTRGIIRFRRLPALYFPTSRRQLLLFVALALPTIGVGIVALFTDSSEVLSFVAGIFSGQLIALMLARLLTRSWIPKELLKALNLPN